MSDREEICVFYSRGPHFLAALEATRIRFPNARVTTYVPVGFQLTSEVQPLADSFARLKATRYGLRNSPETFRLIADLRSRQFTHFVYLFDSAPLRMLAALSGARAGLWYTLDGRIVETHESPFRVAWDFLRACAWGTTLYLGLRVYVRFTSAGAKR